MNNILSHLISSLFLRIITVLAAVTLLLLAAPATAQHVYLPGQSMRSLVPMYPGNNAKGTAWDNIPADSIAWLVRSTYEINPAAKGNRLFRDPAIVRLMCKDIYGGLVRGFGTVTDSFTSGITKDKAFALHDRIMADSGKSCRIRLIEDLVGMKETGRQYHCILGIAPEMQDSKGTWVPLFWIYFPDLKPQLATVTLNDKKSIYPWLKVFDQRDFSPTLISSADTIRTPDIVHK